MISPNKKSLLVGFSKRLDQGWFPKSAFRPRKLVATNIANVHAPGTLRAPRFHRARSYECTAHQQLSGGESDRKLALIAALIHSSLSNVITIRMQDLHIDSPLTNKHLGT